MNFFDYDLTAGSRTPPPAAAESSTAEPTLNEEVSQVVGQLGKLWGGFRKQSQSVLETARKDLSSVVAQAQKEIVKLSSEPVASSSKDTADDIKSTAEPDSSTDATESTNTETEAAASSSKDAGATESSSPPSSASPFQSFFSRVQSSLPPNISSTLEQNLPASLKDSTGHLNVDFAQLKTTLTSEFQRVQGVTRAQAEEYVHKSEALLKEAGEFLKDAVKVLPPEGQEGQSTEFMFDGTDIAFMPPTVGSFGPSNRDYLYGSGRKGKGKETAAQAQHRLAGTRAAAMLAQLKRDPNLLKSDPAAEESAKEAYEEWLRLEVSSKDGGMDSSSWSDRITTVLSHTDDGKVLEATLNTLVPSEMDASTFWSRYFFRVHQIEKDEEKRKQLLAASGTVEEEEDFAWEEDDEDETTTPPAHADGKKAASPGSLDPAHASSATLHPGEKLAAVASYPSSLVTSPTNTSPRESTDGYDVVSSNSAIVDSQQQKAKTVTEIEVKPSVEKKVEDEDEADSDWE